MNQPVTRTPRMTYVLQFHRPPRPASGADDQPPAEAKSLTTSTKITPSGFEFQQKNMDGTTATLELDFATNPEMTLFLEWGCLTISPPSGPRLTFRSTGAGQLSPTPDPEGFRHGTVMYEVTGGTGVFKNARGFITSNFLVNLDTEELFDTHVGILLLQ